MIILGLTGSIAMGKSTVAGMFRAERVPVFDADAAVHDLLDKGGRAVEPVAKQFPGTLRNAAIDRKALGNMVFSDTYQLKALESILHPMVAGERERFLGDMCRQGRRLVVLDIPLLFEAGRDRLCDHVAVVSAPAWQQKRRLRRRPDMTAARMKAILAAQMPDGLKRLKADILIQTGGSIWATRRQVRCIIQVLGRAS